jgi:selenocysteine lyase/cysteine desulfurase
MLESHFEFFRKNIIGHQQLFPTPFGEKKMIYADWIASGRLYAPIEEKLKELVYPFCGNPHTETSTTGIIMTKMYSEAKKYIKQQVNAAEDDILIFEGSGMTACINKLQRILGLRIPERATQYARIEYIEPKPVVFVTHMEHHSNHTCWLETIADVEIINPTETGEVDLEHFKFLLNQYQDRTLKIASVTAASNVTGIFAPYSDIAELVHEAGGYCFVDFACSGPYVHIDMHPANYAQRLDCIFVSPHKFLGGPGTPGLMIFNKCLYQNTIPDHSGGGTVTFTTPWKYHAYIENIEDREDGGTPPFLQGIKTAMCFKLKKEMGVENMLQREQELVEIAFEKLNSIPNLHILQENITHRIGSISFFIDDLHFNLCVKLLNEYYGIQVRGVCACAGTYGHYLLKISQEESCRIMNQLKEGVLAARPGWIRLSLHPTMSNEELNYILDRIAYVAEHFETLGKDYEYIKNKNIFRHKNYDGSFAENIWKNLFEDELMNA